MGMCVYENEGYIYEEYIRRNRLYNKIYITHLYIYIYSSNIMSRVNFVKRNFTDGDDDAVLLEYKFNGHLAIITLNRAKNRNSMTPDVLLGINRCIQEVKANKDVRCVIITGKGSSFSAGADFKSKGITLATPAETSYGMYSHFLAVLDIEVPVRKILYSREPTVDILSNTSLIHIRYALQVIGALNGHAIGGGLGLALVCDIRVGNTKSKYGANFVRLGMHPGMATTYIFPHLMGLPKALEMLLTGRIVEGEAAEKLGLLNHACEGEDKVLEKAMEIAGEIVKNAPIATRWTKRSIYQLMRYDPKEAAWFEALNQSHTGATKDNKEGIRALLQKRDPVFTGE